MSYSLTSYMKLVGRAVLILAIPIALLAITHSPNEYQATHGISALDCDGLYETYLFAVPALLIYGSGLIIALRHRAARWNGLIGIACLGGVDKLATAVTSRSENL